MQSVLKAGDSTVIQVKEDDIIICLFLRPDRGDDDSNKKDRAIFVRGVPVYWQEESVKNIFILCGKIVSCKYIQKPGKPELCGYRVTFKDRQAVEKALNMSFSEVVTCNTSKTHKEDIPELFKEYVSPRLDPSKVIADVDEFLTNFMKQKEEREKTERAMAEPDEEGWITVTKQSKMKMKAQGRGGLRRKKRLMKQNAEKELLKFYKFQDQEEKKHLARVEQLQAEKNNRLELVQRRKFRPY